ncbi:MAG: phosphate ABC transporter ATP-binding protein PstB [Brevinemataceae bacterium]
MKIGKKTFIDYQKSLNITNSPVILETKELSIFYSQTQILQSVSISIPTNQIIAIIGPSGCGKSTLLRTFNRMNDLIENCVYKGAVYLNDQNIFEIDTISLRRQVGMVFQQPNPFPTMSIYENVIAGYTLNNAKLSKADADTLVEEALQKAALWNEVKDKLYQKGIFLSGGQQQRLCIARTLAMKPKVLLLDEPTSALDPKSTALLENVLLELKESVTIVLVTHNIAQAGRVSDYTAFMYLGELVEYDSTQRMFTIPKDKRTEEYLTGKFG